MNPFPGTGCSGPLPASALRAIRLADRLSASTRRGTSCFSLGPRHRFPHPVIRRNVWFHPRVNFVMTRLAKKNQVPTFIVAAVFHLDYVVRVESELRTNSAHPLAMFLVLP